MGGVKDTGGDASEEANPSVTSFLVVPIQARTCTKFNRKQEKKVRKSIK
jgi:hypothetical protein